MPVGKKDNGTTISEYEISTWEKIINSVNSTGYVQVINNNGDLKYTMSMCSIESTAKLKGRETFTYFINSWLVQVEMSSIRVNYICITWYMFHLYVPLHSVTEMLHLNDGADGYQYLNRSGCSTLIAVDDKEQFDITIVSHLSECWWSLYMFLCCVSIYHCCYWDCWCLL